MDFENKRKAVTKARKEYKDKDAEAKAKHEEYERAYAEWEDLVVQKKTYMTYGENL